MVHLVAVYTTGTPGDKLSCFQLRSKDDRGDYRTHDCFCNRHKV